MSQQGQVQARGRKNEYFASRFSLSLVEAKKGELVEKGMTNSETAADGLTAPELKPHCSRAARMLGIVHPLPPVEIKAERAYSQAVGSDFRVRELRRNRPCAL